MLESKDSLRKAFLNRKLINLKYKDIALTIEHFNSF